MISQIYPRARARTFTRYKPVCAKVWVSVQRREEKASVPLICVMLIYAPIQDDLFLIDRSSTRAQSLCAAIVALELPSSFQTAQLLLSNRRTILLFHVLCASLPIAFTVD